MGALQGSLVRNPFEVPGIRELADMSGLELGDVPDGVQLRRLFDSWGKSREFASNVAGLRAWFNLGSDIPNQSILDLLCATGALDAQPLRTVHGPVKSSIKPLMLICGGTTNWMQSRIKEGRAQAARPITESGDRPVMPHYVMGLASKGRPCTYATEINHELVVAQAEALERVPTEADMLDYLFKNHMGFVGVLRPSNSTELEPQVRAFARYVKDSQLYPTSVYVPTNPNALFLPLVVRRMLRHEWGPEFDAPGGKYKLYFSQSEGKLATNPDELANAAEYQNPMTMFSGLARLINEMYLLTQEAE